MAMLKEDLDEPGNHAASEPWVEGETVGQHDISVLAFGVRQLPLVAPEAHRTHRRLLDEATAAGELKQREIRVVDGKNAKEEHVTAEQAASGLKLDVGK